MLVLVSIMGMLGQSGIQTHLDNIGRAAPGGVTDFLKSLISQVQGKAGAVSIAAIAGLVPAV